MDLCSRDVHLTSFVVEEAATIAPDISLKLQVLYGTWLVSFSRLLPPPVVRALMGYPEFVSLTSASDADVASRSYGGNPSAFPKAIQAEGTHWGVPQTFEPREPRVSDGHPISRGPRHLLPRLILSGYRCGGARAVSLDLSQSQGPSISPYTLLLHLSEPAPNRFCLSGSKSLRPLPTSRQRRISSRYRLDQGQKNNSEYFGERRRGGSRTEWCQMGHMH